MARSTRLQLALFSRSVPAIPHIFGRTIDYATLVKVYSESDEGQRRYSAPRITDMIATPRIGNPDESQICTSHVERSNLTVRTMQRRFTRLALGFSRKIENLRAAISLHFAYYNFVWQPRTLKGLSPAMAAGVTETLWEVADLVGDC